jgi:hypothetical protein
MPQIGGKPKKTSSDSKRHFTVVMGGKEHGLYVSSTPSSAAKKAVTKLCAANKSKKVEFSIREITQGSKKKTYGPYKGHIEKLKEPIELKGRVIKYKPVAKLGAKKGVQTGGLELKFESNNGIYQAIHQKLADDPNFLTEQEKDNLGFNQIENKYFKKAKTYLWTLYPYGFRHFREKSDYDEEPQYYYGILKISPSSFFLFKKQSIYIAFRINISKRKLEKPIIHGQNWSGKNIKIYSETIIDELILLAKGVGREQFLQDLLRKKNLLVHNIVIENKNIAELIKLILETNYFTPNNEEFEDLQIYFKENMSQLKNKLEPQKPVMNSKNLTHVKNLQPTLLRNIVNKFRHHSDDDYLNWALKFLLKSSIVLFATFLRNFKKYNKIISVGSGNGYFEYLLEKIFGIKIICIDPNPNLFLKKQDGPFKVPEYPTVDDFLVENISEDCLLILNWPNPDTIPNNNKSKDNYDVEAIKKLKPIGIFIIYEETGIAGSESFHNIRPHPDPYNKDKDTNLLKLESEDKTKLIYKCKREEFDFTSYYFVIDSYKKIN